MTRVAKIERRFSGDSLALGMDLGRFVRLLARHRWAVGADYLHRAIAIGLVGVPASIVGAVEDAAFGRAIREARAPDPVFVLGHWRSGTTHLHNLLGRDPQSTYTTVFQVVFPRAFQTLGRLGPLLLARTLEGTRGYDEMPMGWNEPAEDEIAYLKLHGMSPYGALLFPDHAARFEKYVDFLEATPQERARWTATLEAFVRKVAFATGRRPIVKSCAHTARIRMIREVFPQARFVYVHRDPVEVFASTMHMRARVDWDNFLVRPRTDFVASRAEQVAALGLRVFDRYLEDRHAIPEGRLVEVAYEDLCRDGVGAVRTIYERLDLPGFGAYEPVLTAYLAGISGYRRNRLDIDDRLRAFVRDRWRLVYEAHGYAS